MKTFNEVIGSSYKGIDLSHLNEQEATDTVALYVQMNDVLEKEGFEELSKKLEEGFFGAAVGFMFGPSIGRIIANALGVEKGILYDMLTSRLVSAALGDAIQKHSK